MARNIREKVLSSLVFSELQQQVNHHLQKGWQLEGIIETLPMEVPGLTLNSFTLFMGPVISNHLPYLKTGYTAKLSIDVDAFRQQHVYEVNAQENQFLATTLDQFNVSHTRCMRIRDLSTRLKLIGIFTVADLNQVLPPVTQPPTQTSVSSPLVRALMEHAERDNAQIKPKKARAAAVEATLTGWFDDLKWFNVLVADRLATFNKIRADVATINP